MDKREEALKNCILKIRSGSHLYGTNVATSDEDYLGIFIPPVQYLLGLNTVEEVDCGVIAKDASGRNTSEAVDFKLYELRKFVKLALQNNPNILEILFVNPKNILFQTPKWKRIAKVKKDFLFKGLKEKFIGYALSQKHKIRIKKDNYFDLVEGYKVLETYNFKTVMVEVFNDAPLVKDKDIVRPLFTKKEVGQHIHIGDLCFEPGVYVGKALKMIGERLDKVGNRKELLLKHGYDTKFSMNLIRLLFEGIELLETGNLIFPLKKRKTLMEIRNGEWELQKILDYSEELEEQVNVSFNNSSLPAHPKSEEIEKLIIYTLRRFLI
jgi:hypothetical protein